MSVDAFFEKYASKKSNTGCIEWTGDHTGFGYGIVSDSGRRRVAHRVAWERANGAIPEGLWVCHTCDNPPCVNVIHLFLGTAKDNALDMCRKGRRTTKVAVGENASKAKLTEKQVLAIRRLYADGTRQCDLARRFGVKSCTIHFIVRRKHWRHLP